MTWDEVREAGQSAVEYALVIGLVSAVAAVILAHTAPAWLESIVSLADTALGDA
ncbi:hypothetical protein HRbin29_00836 [bacterium HR29]|jgi:Flp pilus assembly pilin Flp|nr:hypothetical protein HRbin29_00836 [bacterium HR29]